LGREVTQEGLPHLTQAAGATWDICVDTAFLPLLKIFLLFSTPEMPKKSKKLESKEHYVPVHCCKLLKIISAVHNNKNWLKVITEQVQTLPLQKCFEI